MAVSTLSSSWAFALFLLILHLRIRHASSDDSYSFPNLLINSSFRSHIAMSGDAKGVQNRSEIQLTKPEASSSGRIVFTEPVSFAAGHGFSTYFSFSASAEGGGSLALVVAPVGFSANMFDDIPVNSEKEVPTYVAVRFRLEKENMSVGIDAGRYITMESRNFSVAVGKKLHSWIDYQGSYQKIEVRLSDSGRKKPVGPLISFPIDLSRIWNNENRVLSLAADNGNSTQSCVIYLWRFVRLVARHWMHSEPYDPSSKVIPVIVKKENCFLKLIAAMFAGIVCGSAATFTAVYLRRGKRSEVSIVPEECAFEYKKANVAVK